MNADAFIYACRENSTVLPSLFSIIDQKESEITKRLTNENDATEIYRLQGEARGLNALRERLKKEVRLKDGATEQPKLRTIR